MGLLYEGKSKQIYEGSSPDTYYVKYKNTATALNGLKKDDLEGKGELNAAISNIIFEYLSKNGVNTHFVRVIDDVTVEVKRAEIVMVEVIVRNIAAGSFAKKYGVDEGSELCNIVVEFSYKSDELGDPMISDSQITALGLATQQELDYIRGQALIVNKLLCDLFAKCGINLVDFKLEYGRSSGEILLCDEISPDSCRLWDAKTNQKLDKDIFRRDLGDMLGAYREVLRRLRDVR